MENAPGNLSNLKSKADKLDVGKLAPVPVDFSKLSDVVKNNVVKNIYIYNVKIKSTANIIPDLTNLATTTAASNAKINIKIKISNIINLATTLALTAVENKIPNVSNVVKKTDYNTKISKNENKITTDHDHDKYITTQELKNLISQHQKIFFKD